MIFSVSTVHFQGAGLVLRFWRSPGQATHDRRNGCSHAAIRRKATPSVGQSFMPDRLRVVTENAVRLSGSSSRRPIPPEYSVPGWPV